MLWIVFDLDFVDGGCVCFCVVVGGVMFVCDCFVVVFVYGWSGMVVYWLLVMCVVCDDFFVMIVFDF